MRIALFAGAAGGAPSVGAIVDDAKQAEQEGFAGYWMPNIFSYDAIGTLTLAGNETERIELVTAVVPTYPRHPHAMAQQAVTAQAASNGRFVLGIGLSHRIVIEGMFGMSFDRPARHMREYLSVLNPLLRGEGSEFEGEHYKTKLQLDVASGQPVPCMIAAMGPAMLRLAGELTDGTILWMTAAGAVERHIAPRIREGARNAGRPEPRILCGLPIQLTDDPDAARAAAAKQFSNYGQLPSYRSMLDTEGAAEPEDVALLGGEEELSTALGRLQAAGVTDFGASVFGDEAARERTREFLAGLAPELN